jgi:hypothetical protein
MSKLPLNQAAKKPAKKKREKVIGGKGTAIFKFSRSALLESLCKERRPMDEEQKRFGFSMEAELLEKFDDFIREHAYRNTKFGFRAGVVGISAEFTRR